MRSEESDIPELARLPANATAAAAAVSSAAASIDAIAATSTVAATVEAFASETRLPNALRALRHRNYRLYATGQLVSNLGYWLQVQALQWLVYATLTNDAVKLGWTTALQQLPVLALGLFSGAVADAVDRRRLIIFTQTLMLVQSAALATLTLMHGPGGAPLLQIWHILLLAGIFGVVSAFDLPARQAFLLELVPRPDLQNAVAINSLSFNTARIIGPSLAGPIIALFAVCFPGRKGVGEGVCFAINSISFLAALTALLMMRFPRREQSEKARCPHPKNSGAGRDSYLLGGLKYVIRQKHLAAIILFVGVLTIFALPYLMMITIYAKSVLRAEADAFGWIMSSVGIGALLGGGLMASRPSVRGLANVIGIGATGFCSMTALIGRFHGGGGILAACPLFGFAGFFMVIVMIGCQTLVQTLVAEEVRGRVMSLYSMVNVGMMSIGNVIAGYVAKHIGVCETFSFYSCVCLATVAAFTLWLPTLRAIARATPEYRRAVGTP